MNYKKNVLIIARNFPPYCESLGRINRMLYLGNFLIEKNCNVHVLFEKRMKTWFEDLVNPNLDLHTLTHFVGYNDIGRKYANFKFYLAKLYEKSMFLLNRNYIDSKDLLVNSYYKYAKKIIYQENIDIVLTTSPYHSIQKVGLMLKSEFNDKIFWQADLRDPWTLRNAYRKKPSETYEKKVFEMANCVSVVTDQMLIDYQKLYPNSKIRLIENGFVKRPKVFKSFSSDFPKIKIGYFGGGSTSSKIYSNKNLKNLIEVFEENPDLAKKFQLTIQGEFYFTIPKPKNLELDILPSVNHENALQKISEMDIGIVLHSNKNDVKFNLGGKVYDYIASGVLIWCLVCSKALSLEAMHKRVDNKFFFSDIFNKDSIQKTLEEFIKIKEKNQFQNYQISFEDSKKFHRFHQYQKFLEAWQQHSKTS